MEKALNLVGWIVIIILLGMFLIPSITRLFSFIEFKEDLIEATQVVLTKAAQAAAVVWIILKVILLVRK